MKKTNNNKKAAILATVLSGWMFSSSNVLAANLMAGVPSDYVNSQLGAITGSNVTTHVDATPAKGVVTELNRDPAVFNVMVNGESKIFLRQYTYSTTSLKGSILFDSDGDWASVNNPSGIITQAPNAHGAAASGDYLYITDYDFGKIAVAKITETGLVEDTSKTIDLKQAIIEHCGAVFESEYAWVHGEGVIAKDGCLFVMVNVNPQGDYYNYVDSYLMQYAVDVDGSLKYVSHTRAGKNTDVAHMNMYNNMILTTAIGGMMNYGGTKADDASSLVAGEGGTIGNRDTCISIGVISGGQLNASNQKVVVPQKVKDRGLDFRDMQILPNGTAYIMTYNLSGSGGGSTMRVYKTTVTNLLSQNPIDWEEIIDKTTIGNENDQNGSGWFNQIYAEYYTKRVWAEIGDSLVVYTDGDAIPKYTWLTKDFSTNEQLYKWNSLITVRPDEVAGDTALLVTNTPEGITSSSITTVTTVNSNATNKAADYNYGITGTAADSVYSENTKDNSIYTFDTDKVINLSLVRRGDNSNNILATIYAHDGNDITVNSGSNTLQLQSKNYVSTPVGVFAGNGKNVTVNAGKLNIITSSYSGGNSLTNAIWLDPTQTGGGSININSDVNIAMNGGYGGNGIAIQKTDRWGEASYTADKEASININGDVAIKGPDSDTWGIPVNYENVFSRFNNAGILTSVEKSSVTVNGDVDFDVYGNGVTTNAKDSKVIINGGGKITVPSGMKYGYYSLASYLGTINMNTGSDGNTPGISDVQLNGDIFALKTGTINLALTTDDSYLSGIVDNGGTVNLWLQNGAVWVNEANNARYKQDNEDVGNGEKSRVTSFVGGADSSSAGTIYQNSDSKALTIDNYSGYTNVLYDHDENNPTNIYGGNITISKASSGSNINLITDYDSNMNSSTVQNDVLNALANKLFYTAYTSGEKKLTGKVTIAEGLTASSASKYVGTIEYSSSTGQGRLEGTAEPVDPPVDPDEPDEPVDPPVDPDEPDEPVDPPVDPDEPDEPVDPPDNPDITEDGAEVEKTGEIWNGNVIGNNVSLEIKESTSWTGNNEGDNLIANITDSSWTGDNNGIKAQIKLSGTALWKGDNDGEGSSVVITEGSWQGNNTAKDVSVTLKEASSWIGNNSADNFSLTLNDNSIWTNTGISKVENFNSDNGIIDMSSANAGDITIDSYSGSATVLYDHTVADEAGTQVTIKGGNFTITNATKDSKITLVMDREGLEVTEEDSINAALNALAGKLFYTNYDEKNLTGTVRIAEGLTASAISKQTANIVFSGDKGQGSVDKDSITPGPYYPDKQDKGDFTTAITGSAYDSDAQKEYRKYGVIKEDNAAAYNFTYEKSTITTTGSTVKTTNDVVINLNGNELVLTSTEEPTVQANNNITFNGIGVLDISNGIQVVANKNITATLEDAASELNADVLEGDGTVKVILNDGTWNGDNKGNATVTNGTWNGNNAGTASVTESTWSGTNTGTVTLNDVTWTGNNDGTAIVTGGNWSGTNNGTVTIEETIWTASNLEAAVIESGKWSGVNETKATVTLNGGEWTGSNVGTAIINGGTWSGANNAEATINGGSWTGVNNSNTTIKDGTWSGTNNSNATIEGGTWSGDNTDIVIFNGGTWSGNNTASGKVTVNKEGWIGKNTGSGSVEITAASWTGENSANGTVILSDGEWSGNNTGTGAKVNGTKGTWSGNNSGIVSVENIMWTGVNSGTANINSGTWTGANGGTATITSGTWNGTNNSNATIEGGTWNGDNTDVVIFNGGTWSGNNTASGKVTVNKEGWSGNNIGSGSVEINTASWSGENASNGTVTVNGGSWTGANSGAGAKLTLSEEASWKGDNKGNNVTVTLNKASTWTGNNTAANVILTLNTSSVWSGNSTEENFTLNLNDNSVWKNTGTSNVATLKANNGVVDMTASGAGDITVANYSGKLTVLYDHSVADEAGTQVTIKGGNFTISEADKNSEITLVMDRDGLDLTEEDSINAALSALANKLFYTNYEEDNLVGIVRIAEGLTASAVSKQTADITFVGKDGQGTLDKTSINPGPTYPEKQDKEKFVTAITGDTYDSDSQKEYRKSGVIKKDNAATYNFTYEKSSVATTGSSVDTVNDVVINLDGNELNLTSATAPTILANNNVTINDIGALDINNGIEVTKDKIVTAILEDATSKIEADVLAGEGTVKVVLNDGTWDGNNAGIVKVEDGAWNGSNDGTVAFENGTWNGSSSGTANVTDATWLGDNTGTATLTNVTWTGKNIGETTEVVLKDSTWTGYSAADNFAINLQDSIWNNNGTSKVTNLNSTDGVINMTATNAGDVTIANYSGDTLVIYEHDILTDSSANLLGGKNVAVKGGNIVIDKASSGATITLRTDRDGLDLESTVYTDKNLVNATLNALANKLFYNAYTQGKTNLKGYVEIAEGLTASAISKRLENISYDNVTGQGKYEYEVVYPEEQVKDTIELDNGLGSTAVEEELKQAGILKEDGSYNFTSEATELKSKDTINASEKDIIINAEGTLKLTAEETAIKANGKNVTLNAEKSTLTGQTGISADAAEVKINGSVNITADEGIAIVNGGKVIINENAVITSSDTAISAVGGNLTIADGTINGAIDAKDGAEINLGATDWTGNNIGDGANITMTKASKWTGDNNGNNTSLNMEDNTWNGDSNGTDAEITLNGSTWNGNNDGANANVVLNNANWTGSSSETLNLTMTSGAIWNVNGPQEIVIDSLNVGGVATFRLRSNTSDDNFINMTNAAGAKVNTYNGTGLIVYYDHDITTDATNILTGGKGVAINGGSFVINSATSGSVITLRTDRDGLNTTDNADYTDKNLVTETLSALAEKLTYTNFADNNLTAYVEIAEGITASSVSRQEKITFDAEGKGNYKGQEAFPENQVVAELKTAINGSEASELEYKRAGILKDNGVYSFETDPTVIKAEKAINASSENISVKAQNTLNLVAENDAVYADTKQVDVEAKAAIIAGNVVSVNGGSVNINASNEAEKVVLDGDIKVDDDSNVTIKFKGTDSKFEGNITNASLVKALSAGSNEINLTFEKGASWSGYNTTGNLKAKLDEATWNNIGASTVKELVSHKGNINMDGSAAKMTVEQFSGDVTINYEHDGNGDIIGEDFTIVDALKGSKVTLHTESDGIDAVDTNKDQVTKVLGKLANKLIYTNYQDQNIDGRVEIGEGISSSSAYADIKFDATKGTMDESSLKFEVNSGDYETTVMRGAKSAMASSVMMWRSENADILQRMGDVRLGSEENGVWAKYYGGESEFDSQKTEYQTSYKAYQVGYDKKLTNNWMVGAALSYNDAEHTYELGGKGEGEAVGLSVYGGWYGNKGHYVDVMVKGNKLDNEYTVYNDTKKYEVNGDYSTWGVSMSAEYGRRIDLKNGIYIDPSVKFTLGRVQGKSYNANTTFYGGRQLELDQDGFTSAVGEFGLGIGKNFDTGMVYTKFAMAHEFSGDFTTTFAAEETKTTKVDFGDTWYEWQIGGSVKMNDNSYVYATYEQTFGGDTTEDWRIDAGLRWTF
ncbi:MAG: hypothetical protein IJC05_03860 [Phascolarctobacterium sp.]|nr:hypothetical protein [Phascolarctobacterium sp.]